MIMLIVNCKIYWDYLNMFIKGKNVDNSICFLGCE